MEIKRHEKPVLVTRSSLPPLDEYVEMLKPIWESAWLTNMGSYHEEFKARLADGLRILMDRPFPWVIHCMEGKDRTGLVCVLLGALMDADYDELVEDFMTSFTNYYGVTKESDPFRYEGFKSTFVDDYLRIFAGLCSAEDPRGYSYVEGAEDYLRSGGMENAEIERLKRLLRE